ncbi:MAG: isoprenylcysteine carboxylmethyltransferase family protein [Anaerolineales bacterium]|nr:isoprenylcysteine carboxylmethyltransferase family protein [Anaerolineales bacterium]
MQLFPPLQFGWLNGWLLFALHIAVQGLALLLSPRPVVARLFDRSGWSVKQRSFTILGKVFSLVCILLIILTPLKSGSPVFIAGLAVFALGLVGLVIAMINFKDTPPDKPVTRGLYKISRHPQIAALTVIFLGISLAVGSWAVLITLLLSRLFQHFGILAEEEVCLLRYGEPYREYLQRTPRYFVFF